MNDWVLQKEIYKIVEDKDKCKEGIKNFPMMIFTNKKTGQIRIYLKNAIETRGAENIIKEDLGKS